jgi:hypothetical protein
MADLTPNDNPKPTAGSPSASDAGGADTGKDGNGHFPAAVGAHKPATRWQRHMNSTRRWARDTFNREQFVAGFKQLLWVAPLTLLIWVYAEREQQVDDTIRVTIDAHSSDPKIAVRLLDPPDGSVLMNIKGPRSRIDELHRTIESRPTPVRFEVPPGLPTGTQHLLEVKQSVQADSRFTGVTVGASQPPRVNVEVDRLEEREVQVQMRAEDRPNFERPVFVPPNVRVRIPAKALDALKNNVVVYADLSNYPDMTPGAKPEVRGIPLKVDKAENLAGVTIEPSTVSVTVTVRPQSQTRVIPALPIREEDEAPLSRNGVDVKFDTPAIYDVKLQGPPEAIATIDPQKPDNVRAVITLTPAELSQSGTIQKEIRFDLPPGVKFVSATRFPEGQPTKLDVTIIKKAVPE